MTRVIERRTQHGLTLAEIGMALFAIGIGALSIATVYLQRERSVTIAGQQEIAESLAREMTARIAARPTADVRFENAIGVRCTANLSNPTPQAMATNEVACWQEHVAAELPNGAGSISLDTSSVPAAYAVTVSWSQPKGGLVSYTTRAQAYAPGSTSVAKSAK